MSTSTLAYRQKHRPKIKPLPPLTPNLTPADLEAIREIVNASAAEIGRQLRELLLGRGGCA